MSGLASCWPWSYRCSPTERLFDLFRSGPRAATRVLHHIVGHRPKTHVAADPEMDHFAPPTLHQSRGAPPSYPLLRGAEPRGSCHQAGTFRYERSIPRLARTITKKEGPRNRSGDGCSQPGPPQQVPLQLVAAVGNQELPLSLGLHPLTHHREPEARGGEGYWDGAGWTQGPTTLEAIAPS